jgi:dinuclear metal center YbgI/SA1388 family protein
VDRDKLVRYLDNYLRLGDFPQDPSLNGLQVEGKPEVTKVGAAVDAGEAIFRKALEEGVDFLLVHHGLFWGRPFPIVGHHKRRLALLFQGGINLYAAHLPLDAHPEVGNNAVLARALGLEDLEPWDVGVKGRFPLPVPLVQVADRLGQLTGMQPLVHQGGPDQVETVIIVSGSGTGLLAKVDADLFVTGSPSTPSSTRPLNGGSTSSTPGTTTRRPSGSRRWPSTFTSALASPGSFWTTPRGFRWRAFS